MWELARVLAAGVRLQMLCYAPGEFERAGGGSQARGRGKWGGEGRNGTRWARAPTNPGDLRCNNHRLHFNFV
jgi:hypothetical protein